MNLTTVEALARLQSQFPLLDRRASLPPPLQSAHRALLRQLLVAAQPLDAGSVAACLGTDDWRDGLMSLAELDLIVLDDRQWVAGAYPFSVSATPHALEFNGTRIYAMCALDALSVSPLLDVPVEIRSCCHATGQEIVISQDRLELLDVAPGEDVRLGIRWQAPRGPAAHSMCREMVFLRDAPTALRWQHRDVASISLFTLDQGIAVGKGFFAGLFD